MAHFLHFSLFYLNLTYLLTEVSLLVKFSAVNEIILPPELNDNALFKKQRTLCHTLTTSHF